MPGSINWEGASKKSTLRDNSVKRINSFVQQFQQGSWKAGLKLMKGNILNCWELIADEGEVFTGRTALHHAAAGGAPLAVVQQLVQAGALLSQKDKQGDTAEQLARRAGAEDAIVAALRPSYSCEFDDSTADCIEKHFHEVILKVIGVPGQERHSLFLPQVRPLLERFPDTMNFPVPGMYGGFYGIRVELGPDKKLHHLICDSWCRVVGGSGMTHKVTASGAEVIAEGFV